MKKASMLVFVALALTWAAAAMPSQYNDDADGWFGVYFSYSVPVGQGQATYGLEIRGAGQGNIGIDFQLLTGGVTGISAGAVYFYDLPNSQRLTFPLAASLGYFLSNRGGFGSASGWDDADSGIGLELSAGAHVYALGGVYDDAYNESAYAELGGRAAAYIYGKGPKFRLEGLAGGSMSLKPDTGNYYYYY
jgi:hypothetical protein